MGSRRAAQGEPQGGHGLLTPATVALARAGVPFRLHPYLHDPATTAYGPVAAAALGVPETRIYKTLLVEVDGRGLVAAVLPVADQLDLKALA
ncbi:MAG: YbaK/EbsC family protein, partial [Actinomycetota bacterium]